MSDSPFLEAPDEVLSTMNPDGSRKWLFPRLSKGRFWQRRRWVAYALMLLFNALPWLKVGGQPVVLLDVVSCVYGLMLWGVFGVCSSTFGGSWGC